MFWKYAAKLQENTHEEVRFQQSYKAKQLYWNALRHVCSPVNFLHSFRTTFPRNNSGRLPLCILIHFILIFIWILSMKALLFFWSMLPGVSFFPYYLYMAWIKTVLLWMFLMISSFKEKFKSQTSKSLNAMLLSKFTSEITYRSITHQKIKLASSKNIRELS